jgi:hypothetical protein
MKHIYLLLPLFLVAFSVQAQVVHAEELAVHKVVNAWHKAAAEAHFKNYFSYMAENAIFIGTDASENWSKKEFELYAKPHFDKGKAWNFKTLERNVYFSTDNQTAWFDELLDTQMKICRGSGVLIKVKNEWKIAHYVLSISIPNALSNEVVLLKKVSDDLFIQEFKH